jgi:simple sugar transport system substrate-binding protein
MHFPPGRLVPSNPTIRRNGAETAASETDCELEHQALKEFNLAAMSRLISAVVATKPDGLIVSIPNATCCAARR